MIQPADFLPIAERFKSSEDEAERRTSIGRSYFALYDLVEERLRPIVGTAGEGENSHKRAYYYLKSANNRALQSVAQRLSRLRLDRNTADYDLKSTVTTVKSEQAYNAATQGSTEFTNVAQPVFSGAIMAVVRYREPRRD